jgi:hypothetical protein
LWEGVHGIPEVKLKINEKLKNEEKEKILPHNISKRAKTLFLTPVPLL